MRRLPASLSTSEAYNKIVKRLRPILASGLGTAEAETRLSSLVQPPREPPRLAAGRLSRLRLQRGWSSPGTSLLALSDFRFGLSFRTFVSDFRTFRTFVSYVSDFRTFRTFVCDHIP